MQKDSIKREQSQAGLSFAERKNFRPKVKRNRLLLLLVLLMTAATGAWAQEPATTYSVKKLTVPNTWTGDMTTFSAADLPSDFAAVGDDVVTTIPAPTATGNAVLIYGFSGGETKFVEYANGVQSATNSSDFPRDQIYGYVNIMGYEGVYYTSAAPAGYTVSMKDGVKDADKWTVKVGEGQAQALPIGGLKGDGSETVTLQYNGRLKVKGVKATSEAGAPAANIVDLSKLTENTELKDGDVVTGTLGANVKISIADGATVTLDGVTIEGVNSDWYPFAALTCVGDATIILKEGSTNKLKGFQSGYPGIFVPEGKTLTIQGSGSLDASAEGAAGIGGGYAKHCGNITIEGGTITATGAYGAAGIGGGWKGNCGNITIKKTVTSVTATKGYGANSIGAGKEGSCGTVTIEEGANVTQN